MKQFQTKKSLRILSMIMALLVCVGLFMPVNAAAAYVNAGPAVKDSYLTLTLDSVTGSKLTTAEMQMVKVTVTLKEFSGYKATYTLWDLNTGEHKIHWRWLASDSVNATISVDASALKNYTVTVGGKVVSGFENTVTEEGELGGGWCRKAADLNQMTFKFSPGSTNTIAVTANAKKNQAPVINFKAVFPVYSALNFNTVSASYRNNYKVTLYELQGGTYKQVWTGNLNSFKQSGGTIPVTLKAGTRYKVVKSYPTVSGYKITYIPYWLDRGIDTTNRTTPTGWSTSTFYFTPQTNHTYLFETTITFTKK